MIFFPFLSLNWLDLNFWFIAVIRWDTTWSLKFLWWLNFADIGEIIWKKKRCCTSGGHKFSLLFMDIQYYSANKNLQPTFFMIFPSHLNGRLVRRGVLRISKWQGGSNNPLGFKQPPPPPPPRQKKKKQIPGPKFNPQNVPCRISEPLKFSESMNDIACVAAGPPTRLNHEYSLTFYTEGLQRLRRRQ